MRRLGLQTALLLSTVTVVGLRTAARASAREVELAASATSVGQYEKIEFQVRLDAEYDNPFDPDEVDLSLQLTAPSGRVVTLPAFFCQEYQRRRVDGGRGRTDWWHPTGVGTWKVRFAPREVGEYSATARLIDRDGTAESNTVRFRCVPSQEKGFVRIGRDDPRFFVFDDGTPFFPIGQNVAFVGQTQYVDLAKADEIFAKMAAGGANFARVWTCCKDWAMAIEARKSAWGRSWHWNPPIVPIPGSEGAATARKCLKIEGPQGTTVRVEPSHAVALRPDTGYVISGRIKTDGKAVLAVEVGGETFGPLTAEEGGWTTFRRSFTTGPNELWLGRTNLRLATGGTVWLDGLSLKEVDGGAELLWEADVNRPRRGVYNPVDCFMLDRLVESAEGHGIYLMLCLITRDLYMDALADDSSAEYAEAIADAKKLMRYAVARWGYSTNVAAWEFFNEIDPNRPTDRFYTELGEYLDAIDPYRHLRTTSTWHPSAKDCRHAKLDVGQVHHYMRPVDEASGRDEVAVVIDRTQFLRRHAPDKPVLIGEFGLATDRWGLSDQMQRDVGLSHFRRSLWASSFSGNSGTAMFWWWDQLDRQDAYPHYGPLAKFLEGVSFAGMQTTTATVPGSPVRVLGYQSDDRAYLWLSNPTAAWHRVVVEQRKPAEIRDATLEVRRLTPGVYRVHWWDTHQGKPAAELATVATSGQVLRVAVPPFRDDLACKIIPGGGEPLP